MTGRRGLRGAILAASLLAAGGWLAPPIWGEEPLPEIPEDPRPEADNQPRLPEVPLEPRHDRDGFPEDARGPARGPPRR
jgi:hypothetical protein